METFLKMSSACIESFENFISAGQYLRKTWQDIWREGTVAEKPYQASSLLRFLMPLFQLCSAHWKESIRLLQSQEAAAWVAYLFRRRQRGKKLPFATWTSHTVPADVSALLLIFTRTFLRLRNSFFIAYLCNNFIAAHFYDREISSLLIFFVYI